MKKLSTIIAAILALGFTAKAQFYVGGNVGFGVTAAKNSAIGYTIQPEAGYGFNDRMAVGASLGFTGASSFVDGGNLDNFKFAFNPYFRYKFASLGSIDFVCDGVLSLGTETTGYKTSESIKVSQTLFAWGVAVCPAITYVFLPRWTLVTHLASLGVGGTKDYTAFNLFLLNGPTIGVYYSF